RPHDAAVGVAGVAEDAAVAAADQPERARCTVLILAAPLDAVRRPVPVALGIGKQVGIGRRAAVPVVGGQQLYAHIRRENPAVAAGMLQIGATLRRGI